MVSAQQAPAIYECSIVHVRTAPLHNVFRYRSYQWLVDVDDLPRLRRGLRLLADFRAADHFGDPRRTIRENLDRFLAARGIDLRGGTVRMLTHARVLGYVFNPLTVYWCHDAADRCGASSPRCTTRTGSATPTCWKPTPRPGADAEGVLRLAVLPGGRHLPDDPARARPRAHAFRRAAPARPPALRRGRPRPPGTSRARGLVRAAIRHRWSTGLVSARIRWQGVKLYACGLPTVPRPDHEQQESHPSMEAEQ